jgi:hypothetical protein
MIWAIQQVTEEIAIILLIATSMILPFIWFSFKLLAIDLESKVIVDGLWTLGKLFGKRNHYNSLNHVYFKKFKTKPTTYKLDKKQTIVSTNDFKAYLETDIGTFFLVSDPVEERILQKISKIRKKLGIEQ